MQKAVPVVQGGEVDAPNVDCVGISLLHRRFHAHALVPAAFRLQRICDIYSKVLGTEEALHVGLHADPCAAAVLTESCC